MAKRRKAKQPGTINRLFLARWSRAGDNVDRLWDLDGRQWEHNASGLPRDRILELYFDPSVRVAIYECAGTLQWVEPPDRRKSWEGRLEAQTLNAGWIPPKTRPGTQPWESKDWYDCSPLPFEVQEWHSAEDRLLLFDDHD